MKRFTIILLILVAAFMLIAADAPDGAVPAVVATAIVWAVGFVSKWVINPIKEKLKLKDKAALSFTVFMSFVIGFLALLFTDMLVPAEINVESVLVAGSQVLAAAMLTYGYLKKPTK